MGGCRAPGEAVVPCRLRHHDKPDEGPVLRRVHGDGPVPCRPRDGDPHPSSIDAGSAGVSAVSAGLVLSGDLLVLVSESAFIAVLVGYVLYKAVLIALGVSMWRQAPRAPQPCAIENASLGPLARERRGQMVRSPVGRCRDHRGCPGALLRSGRRGRPDGHTRLERTAGALLVVGFALLIPGAAFAVSSETGTDHIPSTFSTRAGAVLLLATLSLTLTGLLVFDAILWRRGDRSLSTVGTAAYLAALIAWAAATERALSAHEWTYRLEAAFITATGISCWRSGWR